MISVPVSLCMVVKNEERNLRACVARLVGLVGEIVVVDTGSTDGTVALARELGARVVSFPWVDSFAAARNESLRHATGDWIFWMDADDRIDEANLAGLRVLFSGLTDENVGYVMKCVCLPDPVSRRSTAVDHVRLFRRHPSLRWRYRVHEQILPSLRALGGTVRWSDVVIQHTGYQDAALRQRKLERDYRLLMMELECGGAFSTCPTDGHVGNVPPQGGDPFVLFNIGMILHEWGRFGEALPYLTESLARSHPADSIVRKLYALISQCQRRLGRPDDALTTCREGQMRYPHDLELLFHESVVLKELGDRPGSEGCLLRLLYAEEGDHFGSVNPELRGSIARHNLAVLYREEGRVAEAESYWQAVVTDAPAYLPAWLGLAELYLEQERWPEWEDATASMEAEPTAWLDAAVMRGRGLLARGDHASARRLLEDATVRAPTAVLPRVLLSHVLLKEGRDMAAAERVLREVLALAPEHTEARHNLAILRRQPAAS